MEQDINDQKSPNALRTISEVSGLIEVPQHVLRFWETRFRQVRPIKRAGGRRYYRPIDVKLLTKIRALLYDEGLTIKGVQKRLHEQGVRDFIGIEDLKSNLQITAPPQQQAENADAAKSKPSPPHHADNSEALALIHALRSELTAIKHELESELESGNMPS